MEKGIDRLKWLGVVTLFYPDREEVERNIDTYRDSLDELIVWDNTPGTNTNDGIAKPLNHAMRKAMAEGFDMLLIMDQDSHWRDFKGYKAAVEALYARQPRTVFTPHIASLDGNSHKEEVSERRLLINSGTVIPLPVLQDIGEADEAAFPLDALDHDIAMRLHKKGHGIVCLGHYELMHSLGQPKRMGPFKLFTPDYNSYRTWSMTRSHIICYRKHRAMMTAADRDFLFKEILLRKFLRIILAEGDKAGRIKAFIKGIIEGCTYKIP